MEAYLSARTRLIAAAEPSASAGRELAQLTDEAVRELSRAASRRPAGRWAVAALGGWGAGTLLPASDLDLLVLSEASEDKVRPFVEELLYPLWDAGLKVGHQVRSPRQQLAAMRDDVTVCTAALMARPIAGEAEWARDVVDRCVADLGGRRARIVRELQDRERDSSPYALEPDLKYGAGGRRDFDELLWVAALEAGRTGAGLATLHERGFLTSMERACVERGAERVAAARWALQRTGRIDSKLTLDAAEDITVDAQDVQRAIADTANVLSRVRRRMRGEAVDDSALPAERVLQLLSAGEDALAEIEEAAWAGRLEPLVPGFRTLLTLRRPGIGHELTVGAHCLRAACSIERLCASAEGPLGQSCEHVEDRPALLVATLVHDIGKRDRGGDHARTGAEAAHDAALAFGLRPSRAQHVADLVRLHLVLPETAVREDIGDEDAILRTAARIGRRELVAPLHVLTVADSLATGDAMWSAWKAALVGSLASRLDAALSPSIDGAGLACRANRVREDALLLAVDLPEHAEARRFIASASLRYLAENAPEDVVSHADLVAEFAADASCGFRVRVAPGVVEGTHLVAVVAHDRPELFSRTAGALTITGLDILASHAYEARPGVALDLFTVTSATRAATTSQTWERLNSHLGDALSDRLELEARIAQRRRHYATTCEATPTVEVETSGYATLLRVHAPDRVGLLYDIATAIAREGLDIRWARVLTVDGVATDTFSLADADGEAVADHGVLGHVAMAIRERL